MKKIDLNLELTNIKTFIKYVMQKTGFEKVILGLSGGIDSAVVAFICKLVLGEKNVHALMMPYKSSHPDSLAHARLIAEQTKINYEIINITDIIDDYFEKNDSDASMLRRGNLMARVRMSILYDFSSKYDALVVGTSNKSEIYTGYCTQHGDTACAFEPLAHLYKTEITELAKLLKIPDEIINKKPTADLWIGQTDEEELGVSYQVIDTVLRYHLDEKRNKSFILNKGVSENHYDLVINRINSSSFKRRLPLVLKNTWEL